MLCTAPTALFLQWVRGLRVLSVSDEFGPLVIIIIRMGSVPLQPHALLKPPQTTALSSKLSPMGAWMPCPCVLFERCTDAGRVLQE